MSRLCRFLLSCLRSDQGPQERWRNNQFLIWHGQMKRAHVLDRRKVKALVLPESEQRAIDAAVRWVRSQEV